MDRAGAALRDAAAELGSGEAELLADHPEERRIGWLLGMDVLVVDDEIDHFVPPPGTAILFRNTSRINGTETTTIVTMPRPQAIGRSKNASRRPSPLIIELMKFSSSIAPSTMP